MGFDILSELEKVGGFLSGHFVLKSGKHSDRYLDKDCLYVKPDVTERVGRALARLAADSFDPESFDVVLGPALGGVLLASYAARNLGTLSVFAEKDGEGFAVKRQAKWLKGANVLITEDICTTAGTIQAVADLVEPLGGKLIGGVCLINRGNVHLPWLRSLATLDIESWAPADCPLCARGVPIDTNVGHGAKKG